MILDRSIDEVKEKADLVEVIGKYTKLKKAGANYVGLSPFVTERTPSFTVSPAKGLYKCFSSGKGGNSAVSFVMEMENFTFPEAVKYLAQKYNVELEETVQDEEPKEDQLKRADYLNINKAAARRYVEIMLALTDANYPNQPSADPVIQELLYNRQLTPDSLISFQIGFAPNRENYISRLVIEKGLYQPALDLGLIKSNQREDNSINNYDVFRNRIMFPIMNDRGEIVGFGGRTMEADSKRYAKYLNSAASLLYKKDQVLYGLYQGGKAIREMRFAVVVEGYYDVISFHQAGMPNTVAPCGTALTDGHAKLLKRYTNHIILMGDQDAAGQKANLKAVDLLLRHNFKVEICELPEKHDPDSFARALISGDDIETQEPELAEEEDGPF